MIFTCKLSILVECFNVTQQKCSGILNILLLQVKHIFYIKIKNLICRWLIYKFIYVFICHLLHNLNMWSDLTHANFLS